MPGSSTANHDPVVVQSFGGANFVGGNGGDGINQGIGGRGGEINIQATAHQTNNYNMPTFVGPDEGLRALYGQVAIDAMHDSKDEYDEPKCHPNTCRAIIEEILDWADNDNTDYPFLWMNGPVGSGKSTIARTIAQILTSIPQYKGIFAASFFFRREVPGRNNPSRLVSTIAYQLTKNMPQVKRRIEVALAKEPFIFSQSFEDQIAKLIEAPFTELAVRSRPALLPDFQTLLDLIVTLILQLIYHPSVVDDVAKRHRRLVIIDGLDECGNLETQVKILQVLFKVIRRANFPLFFLIVSRPEPGIRNFFNQNRVDEISRRLILNNEQYQLDSDIETFLVSEFDEIKINHPSASSISQHWPAKTEIAQLAQKASGQFLYATTVMKFIKSHKTRPAVQLQLILEQTSDKHSTPFTAMDNLYIRIFESAFDSDTANNCKRALEIFSLLLLRSTSNVLTVEDMESFFDYNSGDVRICLNDLHSVVNVPPSALGRHLPSASAICIYHTSLREFLLDKKRANNFYIDTIQCHILLAERCIKHISSSFSPGGTALDSHTFKISYFDLQHHYIALHNLRLGADSLNQHGFNFDAYPNIVHHRGTIDMGSLIKHRVCLLLPFLDHIRQQHDSDQTSHVYRKCIDDLEHFSHALRAKETALQFLYDHVALHAILEPQSIFPQQRNMPKASNLVDWAKDDSDSCQCFWLYGTNSAMRSTVTNSIVQMFTDEGKAVATFSFSKSDPDRKDATLLVPTIAYQLHLAIPEIGQFIADGIARDPAIFSRHLPGQLETLILRPWKSVAQLPTKRNKITCPLVILDNLDECESLTQVLKVLSRTIRDTGRPWIKFLISSRLEHDIQSLFNDSTINHCSKRLALDDQLDIDIHGSVQKVSGEEILEKLWRHIAPGALHDSIGRPGPAFESTRTEIITPILDWANGKSVGHPFLWLCGAAGTGKTTIAQTIAEALAARRNLAASHFFSRVDVNGVDINRFIPTIAYQLTVQVKAYRELLLEVIESDPTIFSRSIEEQLRSLIVEPLTHLMRHSSSAVLIPRIVVIDALDECGDSVVQRQILSALLDASQVSDFPLSFLISSRPEFAIRSFFEQQDLVGFLTQRIDLPTQDTDMINKDIEIYLRSEFDAIKKNHPARASLGGWPSESDIAQLLRKSSGLFIYARSVMKFVGNTRRRPRDQLDIILGLRQPGNQTPFASLDGLYSYIVASVDDWEHVAPIFHILLGRDSESNPKSLGDIAELLRLDLVELQTLLANLHSIVYVPPINSPQEKICLYHASVADFLRDPVRAGPFYIDTS